MSPFKTVESRRIYQGRVVTLRLDTLDVGGGRTVQREVVEHGGAIVVAALDDKGRVLMVRQYRHPTGERLLELPAGTLEPNEAPLTTAIRELQEETGFYPGQIEKAGGFYSAPGFCSEFLHLFIARELQARPLDRDEDEDIEVVPVELARVRDLILSGEIKDSKSIAGLFVLFLLESRLPGWKKR